MKTELTIEQSQRLIERGVNPIFASGLAKDPVSQWEAAIVGSIAEARWGVPWLFGEKAMSYLPKSMQSVIHLIYTGI